jgi:hypothetical protein
VWHPSGAPTELGQLVIVDGVILLPARAITGMSQVTLGLPAAGN